MSESREDWYTDEQTGTHCFDLALDRERQLSILFFKNGRVKCAARIDGVSYIVQDATEPPFIEVLRKFVADANPSTT